MSNPWAPLHHEIPAPDREDFKTPSLLEGWSKIQAQAFPEAKVYHAIGTGLAALLASAATSRRKSGARFLLSEHANYAKEISLGSDCLESGQMLSDISSSRAHLMAVFTWVAKISYRRADAITALDSATRNTQIQSGASPSKCSVIPNGVSLQPKSLPAAERFHVAYLGRINPLKGTDLFIEAANLVSQRVPGISFSIVGPADCEIDYELKCRKLSDAHDTDISWLGPRTRNDWGCEPNCVVLSSRSEVQPFTILEAFSRGIPVVAPDVGGCREMISGSRESGPGGIIVQSPTPSLIARGIEALARNRRVSIYMGNQGRKKARLRYSRRTMVSSFEREYQALTLKDRRTVCA